MRVQKHFIYLSLIDNVLRLLKSWEYKNKNLAHKNRKGVLRLLKSWEYKNALIATFSKVEVLRLLKSWEYKNDEENLSAEDAGFTVT